MVNIFVPFTDDAERFTGSVDISRSLQIMSCRILLFIMFGKVEDS